MKKPDFLRKLGKTLESKIRGKGYLTLEQFAHENNIPKSTLYLTVNGEISTFVYNLYLYAQALEISLSDLLNGV